MEERIVIDANILFSALIKNSFTAKIIFDKQIKLYSPDFIIEEFLKYHDLIIKKTYRNQEEFNQATHMLMQVINIVPIDELVEFLSQAEMISPDEKDILYIALALKLGIPIWSNDKRLKNQNSVKVYSTEELINCFGL